MGNVSPQYFLTISLSSPVRGKSSVAPHKAEGRHGEDYEDIEE